MPRLSTWFIRLSLIYLAAGFTFGAAMLVNKGLGLYPQVSILLPVHVEILLVGWFVQLAIGVAYWILPRLGAPAPRGNEKLAWAAFWLLNVGIAFMIAEAFSRAHGLAFIGRLLELGGATAFVIASWKRIKSFQG